MDNTKIIERLKVCANLKSDADIARLFGMTPQNFNNKKLRGSLIPIIVDWCIHNKVDINWMITGNRIHSENDIADYAPKKDDTEAIEPIDFSEYRKDKRSRCRRKDDAWGDTFKTMTYILLSGDPDMIELTRQNLKSTASTIAKKHQKTKSPDHDGQGDKK